MAVSLKGLERRIAGAERTVKVFLAREDGAISVEWVGVAAIIAGLGLAVATTVKTGTHEATTSFAGSFEAGGITLAQADVEGGSGATGEGAGTGEGGGGGEDDVGGDPFLEPDPEPQPEPEPEPEPTPEPEPEPEVEPEPEPTGPPPGCWYNGAGKLKCN